MSVKSLTATVTAMAIAAAPVTHVSAATIEDSQVFAPAANNTMITMTAPEMQATEGEFACGGLCWTAIGFGAGLTAYGAGFGVGYGLGAWGD